MVSSPVITLICCLCLCLALFAVSSLSQASVAELSVLLRSMEESRKAKVNSSSAQSVSNAISESKSQVAGEAKGALPVSTRKLSSSGSSSRVRSPGTVDILVKDIDTASLSASGRPDLKQFKRQQQEAHRRAKEAEFFKSRGIAPPVMAADLDSPASSSNANSQRPMNRDQHRDQHRDRDRDLGSMPPVELYLKAPNSDAILRATLLGNGDDMRFQSHNNSLATGKSSDKSAVARAHKESESQVSSTSPDGSNQAPFPYPVGGGDRSHHQQRQSEGSSSREGIVSITTALNENRRNPRSKIPLIFSLRLFDFVCHSRCPSDVKPLLQSKSHPRLKGLASLGPIHMSSGAVSRPSSSSRVKETRESGAGSGSGSGGSIEWSTVQRLFDQGDAVGAFSIVVERGELEDLARAMQLLGPKPHVSASVTLSLHVLLILLLSKSDLT